MFLSENEFSLLKEVVSLPTAPFCESSAEDSTVCARIFSQKVVARVKFIPPAPFVRWIITGSGVYR